MVAINPYMKSKITNHLGNTVALVPSDASRDLMTWLYFPFGKQVTLAEGFADRVTEAFTTKELDKGGDLDLYYFGARYYDADFASWTQVDPMRQFSSPYLYAGNGFNSLSSVDPDGNSILAQDVVNKDGQKENMAQMVSNSGNAELIRKGAPVVAKVELFVLSMYANVGMFIGGLATEFGLDSYENYDKDKKVDIDVLVIDGAKTLLKATLSKAVDSVEFFGFWASKGFDAALDQLNNASDMLEAKEEGDN